MVADPLPSGHGCSRHEPRLAPVEGVRSSRHDSLIMLVLTAFLVLAHSPFQPYGAWICVVIASIVIFFKGFDAFIPTFKPISFVTNYIGIPIFFLFYITYKLIYKSKWVSLEGTFVRLLLASAQPGC